MLKRFEDDTLPALLQTRVEPAWGAKRDTLMQRAHEDFRGMAMQQQQDAGAGQAQYTQQMNDTARGLIVATCREMYQQVYSQQVPTPVLGSTVTIPLRNVGLVKRIVVEVTATVAQGAAETQRLTPFGLANFFSNINITDLSNYNRINTSGWHTNFLASLRRQAAYGGAYLNDSPVNMGSNFQVMGPNTPITAGTKVRMFYELPLSYSDFDLRGSIYAAVVNGTWQMQLTVNNGFFEIGRAHV